MLKVKFAGEKGEFDSSFTGVGNFCTDEKQGMLLFDVNGDGKIDILCQSIDLSMEIRLNNFESNWI